MLGNIEDGVAATKALIEGYSQTAEKMTADYELLAEMGELQEQPDYLGAWDLDSRLEQAMSALRCPPPEAEVSVLSGGERQRVALCRLLLSLPDLLLLDEPTNHLDAENVQWLEHHMLAWEGGGSWFWLEGKFDSYHRTMTDRLGPDAGQPHRVSHGRLAR